jgi:hypothetical protein
MYSEDNPNVWTMEKARVTAQRETITLFPIDNIA